jgi:DNA helicase-2/ATP-dependent DNA helicase PcrA
MHSPTASFDFSHLNSPQQEAVNSVEGPVLILAGAGTGKTRVLTTRVANLLQNYSVYPSHILAVTFTNKAAQEMKHRINAMLGHGIEGMWVGTFHALGVRVLRQYAQYVGLQTNFTILDTDDQLRLIKQLIKANNLDEKQFPPRSILGAICRYKDKGITAAELRDTGTDVAITIYKEYQERLVILNAVDFGDLLLHNLTIFKNHPEVLQHYQEQFHYIHVDEYQDTNVAQYLWLRLLALGHNNICCVGDDDQSIYGWRGAEVGNILRFEKDFPGAKIIRLEQNYRSTGHILAAASGIIAHNGERLGKTLWTEDDMGELLLVRGTWNSEDEARYIGEEVENFQRHGYSLKDMAVLVRAGFQTRELEERFLKLGLPYRIVGGLRFYERMEIRDALAYIRLLVQPDDGLAFERIVNTPKRGVGEASIQMIHTLAREQGISLPRAAEYFASHMAKGTAKTGLQAFFMVLARWRNLLNTHSHADVARIMLDESGYTGMWQEDKSPDAAGRLENLKELVGAIEEFVYFPTFLEHVGLVMDNDAGTGDDKISVMTLHAAKGLEFPIVYLSGWEEGVFPHPRAMQESGNVGLEEERRLAYVGISRARERAIITYSLNRRTYMGWNACVPSRFIRELPLKSMIHINPSGNVVDASRHKGAKPLINKEAPPTMTALHNFKEGDKVFHQKFGYGYIFDVEGPKLRIEFEHSGAKTIVADFVTAA